MAIRWLFFDIGYTLINEDQVWKKRFEEQRFFRRLPCLAFHPKLSGVKWSTIRLNAGLSTGALYKNTV